MAFVFKKEYRDLYQAKAKPMRVEVPAMTFAAVAGTGDPNEEGGAYSRALALLYGFSYSVKMAKMGSWQPEGYFDYVVPPLEGLWWSLAWVSLIRQPDFVTPEVFARVCAMLAEKKSELAGALDRGDMRLIRFAEGPCVQIMHRGPYDDEPATIAKLASFIEEEGLETDIAEGGESPVGHRATGAFDAAAVLDALDAHGGMPSVRLHHEIYLGDPRRTKPENLKTVIRHPVRVRA